MPFRQAMKIALPGMAMAAALLLLGGAWVVAAAYLSAFPARIAKAVGEALMLAGGLVSVATALAAWREMFRKSWPAGHRRI
ncbi:MAG: hypothetical protein ACOY6N_09500 [Pseudomonadota bacterium]